jgi:hypothetical protein
LRNIHRFPLLINKTVFGRIRSSVHASRSTDVPWNGFQSQGKHCYDLVPRQAGMLAASCEEAFGHH